MNIDLGKNFISRFLQKKKKIFLTFNSYLKSLKIDTPPNTHTHTYTIRWRKRKRERERVV